MKSISADREPERGGMKILIDARSLGQKPSGIGIYIYNIVLELLKHKEYELVLLSDVSRSDEMRELEKNGAKLLCYGKAVSKNFGLFLYYRFVQSGIHREKPDLFWEANSLVPIRIKNPYGKLAVTIHDVFPITLPKYYGRLYEAYFKYGLKKTIEHFDILIYNSQETRSETEKIFPKAKSRDFFISYIIVPKLPRREITDNQSFLYIGNIEKRKGSDILLKSYLRYRELGGEKELRLGGKIREKDVEELLTEACRKQPSIRYLGYLSEEEKNREYASCSCFVFPSQAEGFGIPIVEVMNYYKPIIVTPLSIFEEIAGKTLQYIEDGQDEKERVENCAREMLDYKREVDKEEYDRIVGLYDKPALGKRIREYLEKVIGESDEAAIKKDN